MRTVDAVRVVDESLDQSAIDVRGDAVEQCALKRGDGQPVDPAGADVAASSSAACTSSHSGGVRRIRTSGAMVMLIVGGVYSRSAASRHSAVSWERTPVAAGGLRLTVGHKTRLPKLREVLVDRVVDEAVDSARKRRNRAAPSGRDQRAMRNAREATLWLYCQREARLPNSRYTPGAADVRDLEFCA
jgi:hypothetical protein